MNAELVAQDEQKIIIYPLANRSGPPEKISRGQVSARFCDARLRAGLESGVQRVAVGVEAKLAGR